MAWLHAAQPDIVCLQELKAEHGAFPAASPGGRGLQRRVARPAQLERRRHPGPRRRARAHPRGPARRPADTAGPLHRGGGQRHPGRLDLPAQRQPAARAEIRLQARLVRTPDRPRARAARHRPAGGPRRRLQRRAHRRRHLPDPLLDTRTRCSSRNAGTPSRACSPRAGPTRCATSIPRRRSTPSGITGAIVGSGTPGSGWTTCCSAPPWRPAERRRRRPLRPRRGEGERPRPGLDTPEGAMTRRRLDDHGRWCHVVGDFRLVEEDRQGLLF